MLLCAMPLGSARAQDGSGDLAQVPGSIRRALFEAQALREEGDFAGAAHALEECRRKHPDQDHVLLRFHLANALVMAERPADALGEYQAALDLDPHFAQAWINLGQVAYSLERFGVAGEAFVRAHQESPAPQAGLLYNAAVAYYLDEQADQAVELLLDLTGGGHGEPELEWYRLLLFASLDLERIEDVAVPIDQMLERFGGDPEAWRLLYQYAANAGDFRRAAVALTVGDYLGPFGRDELMQAGDLYLAIGVPAQACVFYERALSDSAAPRELEHLSSAYLASHDEVRAQETLTRALSAQPTARLWSLQGDLHYMQGRYDEAHLAYRTCSRLDSTMGRPHLMMARCVLELGRREEAIAHLEVAKRHPEQAQSAEELLRRIRADISGISEVGDD
jgi:tetratricopeptide (TPR) repeat protein